MLPTFVIGLREGVEASLIVGIVAAFLIQQGRTDALRRMWVGVAAAVVVCIGVAVVLEVVNENLPQRQQEMLETVVALVAVAMVTYMIVFMRRHARGLRGELEARAGVALASGSASALVAMAFLAVMREGLETSVFLLAAFESSRSKWSAGGGALLGIAVAVVVGVVIYRGGRRVNLARFFTVTGLVLVLVAAGLVSFAAHTAHEAGWMDIGQGQALDLSGFVRPGTVRSALITGVLGIQPKPAWAEAIAWLAYLVPVTAFVLWPRRSSGRSAGRPSASVSQVDPSNVVKASS
jgi:high-affinity iron transporter